MNELWLVLQCRDGQGSEFQGIFSTKEKAVAACVQDHFCVAAVNLDEVLAVETSEFPHAWYPRLQEEPAR